MTRLSPRYTLHTPSLGLPCLCPISPKRLSTVFSRGISLRAKILGIAPCSPTHSLVVQTLAAANVSTIRRLHIDVHYRMRGCRLPAHSTVDPKLRSSQSYPPPPPDSWHSVERHFSGSGCWWRDLAATLAGTIVATLRK